MDGVSINFNRNNPAWVSLKEALAHPDWLVDWDMGLKPGDRELALNPTWQRHLIFE